MGYFKPEEPHKKQVAIIVRKKNVKINFQVQNNNRSISHPTEANQYTIML